MVPIVKIQIFHIFDSRFADYFFPSREDVTCWNRNFWIKVLQALEDRLFGSIDHEKQSSRCETQSSQQCGECRILYYKYLLRSSIIESRKFACHTIFSKVFISTRYVFIQFVCTFYTDILIDKVDPEILSGLVSLNYVNLHNTLCHISFWSVNHFSKVT